MTLYCFEQLGDQCRDLDFASTDARASATFDQSLLSRRKLKPIKPTLKTLISQGGCPGCSESLFGAKPKSLDLSRRASMGYPPPIPPSQGNLFAGS